MQFVCTAVTILRVSLGMEFESLLTRHPSLQPCSTTVAKKRRHVYVDSPGCFTDSCRIIGGTYVVKERLQH
jgi:hypothetical protein